MGIKEIQIDNSFLRLSQEEHLHLWINTNLSPLHLLMLLAVFGQLKPKGNAMQRSQQQKLLESILMEMKRKNIQYLSLEFWGGGYFFLWGKLATNHFEKQPFSPSFSWAQMSGLFHFCCLSNHIQNIHQIFQTLYQTKQITLFTRQDQ